MGLTDNLMLNLYSIVLLVVVDVHTKNHHDTRLLQNVLFLWVSRLTILLLIMDILARFDGLDSPLHPVFNQVGNFMLYLMGPALGACWFLYVHLQVRQRKSATARLMKPLAILLAVNGLFCLISLYTGWIYTIDAMNIYHRGPLFFVPVILDFGMVIVITAYLIASRKKLDIHHFSNLMVFPVLPALGMLIQLFFYHIPIIMNCIALAILIIFLNIQNQNIYMDHLTGIYNRKRLDKYLEDRVSNQGAQRPFGGILIDVDNFKKINDTYGHGEGDRVLREIAQMLRSCLRNNDFIARYGGDEFFIVVDTGSRRVLDEIIRRIQRCLEKLNASEVLNQPVGLSMGYGIYNPKSGMTVGEFQESIDTRMYDTKKRRKDTLPSLWINPDDRNQRSTDIF